MYGITLYMGCMFSGKTSELIRECRRNLKIKRKILAINYINDNRYSDTDYITSHNLDKVECIKVSKLSDVNENIVRDVDCVMIDEGQFFPDLKEYVIKWCEEFKKFILVIGLDGDYKREKFGQILDLIPYCDNVYKLNALCTKCNDGTEALFTHRITHENSQISIGSTNYIPLCRTHYLELNK